MEDLTGKVERLQKQIRITKDKEIITAGELKHLKDELSRYGGPHILLLLLTLCPNIKCIAIIIFYYDFPLAHNL